MKITIAIDKFKGTLSAKEAADAIEEALQDSLGSLFPIEIEKIPMADGGDGSMAAVRRYLRSQERECRAHDPLGREIPASYLLYREEDGTLSAFIELARVSGLVLLEEQERNPLETNTFGVGELIADAVRQGARRVSVSIGGSATNDGGTGMLQALGYRFLDGEGRLIERACGGTLERIAKIVPPDSQQGHCLSGVHLQVICDVTNPLLGPQGATMVYGPQKGADAAMLERLEAGMAAYAKAAGGCGGHAEMPGAGAAGGTGFALAALLGAEMVSGWNFFAQITSLEEKIASADLVISGEGKIDAQSFCGKVIDGVIRIARRHGKPVVLFCGVSDLEGCGGASGVKMEEDLHLYSLSMIEPDLNVCLNQASEVLKDLVHIAVRYSGLV